MAPRVKITKKEIIETAISLVRKEGSEAVNARSIAAELGCSTQPIFSNFATMEELHSALIEEVYGIYFSFLQNEVQGRKYPEYKAFGMAYTRFAREEKELFKLLFMCDKTTREQMPSTDFNASIEMIMKANGISRERAILVHLEMWACVHGIGTMLATSYLDLDEELISQMLSDVYQGVRASITKEK